MQSGRGAGIPFSIPIDVAQALRALGRREGVTLYMTLLAGFQALLSLYGGDTDIPVGTPVAGRTRRELEGLIGCFVNTLVMRTDLRGQPSGRALLARVRETALGAYAHQDLPFERLVDALQPTRDLSHHPLFQVMFTLQRSAGDTAMPAGLSWTPVALERTAAQFDLSLSIVDEGDALHGVVEYSTDLFDRPRIAAFIAHLQIVLAQLSRDPDAALLSLPLATDVVDDRRSVRHGPTRSLPTATVPALIDEQTDRTPDAIAVRCEGTSWTYAALNRAANRLAAALVRRGITGGLVAIPGHRGPLFVIAMLGVWKAGAAYVPLDPHHPASRHRQIIEQSGARLILDVGSPGAEPAAFGMSDANADVPSRVSCASLLQEREAADLSIPCTRLDDLAYVIYTSGSTGAPKGAMVTHRGMLNHLLAKQEILRPTAHDRIAQTASACFDISVWQFITPLLVGASVDVVPDDVAHHAARLLATLATRQVTIWETVPSLLRATLTTASDADTSSRLCLRWVLATGEALPRALAERWRVTYPEIPLINAYGPTECSDDVTHQIVGDERDEEHQVPIGFPIANTSLFVLDGQGNTTPLGVPGELYIGGAGVGAGYLADARRTALAFVPDGLSQSIGARLYRTGDLVRVRPDGALVFLGRADHQVKLRGFRIEPAEIEAALMRHPAIEAAVVCVRTSAAAEPELVAFVVARAGTAFAPTAIRQFLGEGLPAYMVPSRIVRLEALPLTANGKIDRDRLPAAPASELPRTADVVAPRNAVEEVLAAAWAETLGLANVGVLDNFFELGGNSMLALTVIARAEARGLRLEPADFYRAQTIAELAEGPCRAGIDERVTAGASLIVPFGTAPAPRHRFFCVHPVSGRVQAFWALARRLPPEIQLHGVRSRGVSGDGSIGPDIEQIAAEYIEAMKQVQPDGPYLLGGYSFGVFVAFEMARQLAARGERIALLALIDAAVYAPSQSDPDALDALIGAAADYAGVIVDREALACVAPDARVAWVLQRIEGHVPAPAFDMMRALFPIGYHLQRAQDRYMARVTANVEAYRYPGRITVFRTAPLDGASSGAVIGDPHGGWTRRPEPDMGWGRLSRDGVDVHTIAGTHETLLASPSVDALATPLAAAVRTALQLSVSR